MIKKKNYEKEKLLSLMTREWLDSHFGVLEKVDKNERSGVGNAPSS